MTGPEDEGAALDVTSILGMLLMQSPTTYLDLNSRRVVVVKMGGLSDEELAGSSGSKGSG